jgi:hypothetical protein
MVAIIHIINLESPSSAEWQRLELGNEWLLLMAKN